MALSSCKDGICRIRHSINNLRGFCLFKYIITFIQILSMIFFIIRIRALILLSYLSSNPLPQQEPVPVAVIHVARRPVKVKIKDPAILCFHPKIEPAHPPGTCPGCPGSMCRLHVSSHPSVPFKIRPSTDLPDDGVPLLIPAETLRTGRILSIQRR